MQTAGLTIREIHAFNQLHGISLGSRCQYAEGMPMPLMEYERAVFKEACADVRPGLKSKLRTPIETLLAAGLMYETYRRTGMDVASDYAFKVAIGILGSLAAFALIHIGLAWATAPRRLFYAQRQYIAKVEKDRDAAIASQEKQTDKKKACAELTDLIRRGRRIREAIESAVANPPSRNSAVRSTSDAEHPWQFQQEIEQIAKDRYPSLYAAMIAAPTPGFVSIGPSHKSSTAAKVEQILNLLATEAARYCD